MGGCDILGASGGGGCWGGITVFKSICRNLVAVLKVNGHVPKPFGPSARHGRPDSWDDPLSSYRRVLTDQRDLGT